MIERPCRDPGELFVILLGRKVAYEEGRANISRAHLQPLAENERGALPVLDGGDGEGWVRARQDVTLAVPPHGSVGGPAAPQILAMNGEAQHRARGFISAPRPSRYHPFPAA